MRPHRHGASRLVAASLALAVIVPAPPAVAQDGPDDEPADVLEFERPSVGQSVRGMVRDDGTIVLGDADYCSFLLGAIWGGESLASGDGSVRPVDDEIAIGRCVDALRAYEVDPTSGGIVPEWAFDAHVVPDSIAALLPRDVDASDIADDAFTLGSGSMLSAPFSLSGGTYFVDLDDSMCESWSGVMRSVDDATVDTAAIDTAMYVDDILPGDYVWEVVAPDCEWSVDLIRFDLGPDELDLVPVPEILGSTREEAIVLLNDARLEVHTCQIVRDTRELADRIVHVEPAPGTEVELGSAIRIHIDWPGTCDDIPLSADGVVQ